MHKNIPSSLYLCRIESRKITFFGTRPESEEKDGWILIRRSLLSNCRGITNKMDGKKSIFTYKSFFTLYRYLFFSVYALFAAVF
jgi:hypothetical protein